MRRYPFANENADSSWRFLFRFRNAEGIGKSPWHIASYHRGIAVRLEKKKLLTGSIDPQDRRVKHVSLSKSGWAMYYDAQVHIEEEEERLVTGLTGEERAQLKKLLQKIYDTLK